MDYSSEVTIDSTALPGVCYTIRRVSFARRLALTKILREIGKRLEFLEASRETNDLLERLETEQTLRDVYLRWGLVGVKGLQIDGEPADVELLLAAGPEAFCHEILQRLQQECSLSSEERKN